MQISQRAMNFVSATSITRRPDPGSPGAAVAQGDDVPGGRSSIDILDELTNLAAGGTNSSIRLANLGAGEAPLKCHTVNTREGMRTYAYGGEPVHDPAFARDAEALALEMVLTLGSDGRLSISDYEKAAGLGQATCSANSLQAIRSSMETNWNQLSGGADSMTAEQLSEAIKYYLG